MQMKKRIRSLLIVLLMHVSGSRRDHLERGRCYQCIGAVTEDRLKCKVRTEKLLKSSTLQVFHSWLKAGNVPEKKP